MAGRQALVLAAATALEPGAASADPLQRVLAVTRVRGYLEGALHDFLPAAGSEQLETPQGALQALQEAIAEHLAGHARQASEMAPRGSQALSEALGRVQAAHTPGLAIRRCQDLDRQVSELRARLGHASQDLQLEARWLGALVPGHPVAEAGYQAAAALEEAGLGFGHEDPQAVQLAREFLRTGLVRAVGEALRPMKEAPGGFALRAWKGTRHRDKDYITDGVVIFRTQDLKPGVRLYPFRALDSEASRAARGAVRALHEAVAMGKARSMKPLGWLEGPDPESPEGREVLLGAEIRSQATRVEDLAVPELALPMDTYRMLKGAVLGAERLVAMPAPTDLSQDSTSRRWLVGALRGDGGDMESIRALVAVEEFMAPLSRRGVGSTMTVQQAQKDALAKALYEARAPRRGR